MGQAEIIHQIKTLKSELWLKYDGDKAATLYRLIDFLEVQDIFHHHIAFATFKTRYLANKDSPLKENVPGGPLFYYCKGCFELLATLPENHTLVVPPYCLPCLDIASHGLMPEFKRRVTNEEN
jgi:hypothetical protein